MTSDLPVVAFAASGADDVIELKGSMSSLERKGDWQVPRKLVLRWRMGSVKLDFTQTRIVHPVIEIELDVTGGSVEMRLPQGASVSLDGVEARMGSVRDHRQGAPATGRPHFVLEGKINRGSVEVRGRAARGHAASENPRLGELNPCGKGRDTPVATEHVPGSPPPRRPYCYARGPCGTTPSCCIMDIVSITPQCS